VRPLFNRRLQPFTRAFAEVATWNGEAIHQSRVGSRRLRELIPLLELDRRSQRRVSKQLRQVTRRLGRLREADVQAQILDELRREGHKGRAIDYLAEGIADETRRTREWLTRRLDERHRERLVGTLEQIAEDLTSRQRASRLGASRHPKILLSAIDARVARRAARLQSAIDAAGALYSPAALHDVRIALKKFRYALEVSMEAREQDDSDTMTLLKRAQNTLGRLHDLEMFLTRVRHAELEADDELLAELARLAATAELECRELHGKFLQDRATLEGIVARLVRRTTGSDITDSRAAS
jgi:CHAD domain-containing protein